MRDYERCNKRRNKLRDYERCNHKNVRGGMACATPNIQIECKRRNKLRDYEPRLQRMIGWFEAFYKCTETKERRFIITDILNIAFLWDSVL